MTEHPLPCDGRDEIALLVHGELPGEQRRRLLTHMEQCAPCRTHFVDMVAVEAEYSRLPVPCLTPMEKERLLARVTGGPSETSTERAPVGTAALRRNASRGVPWRALAAAAVVALAYLAGWVTSPSAVVDPAIAERLASIETELIELRRDRFQMAAAHPSAVVRMKEIVAVQEVGSESVTDLLLSVLERDPNPNVRLAALDALRTADLSEAEAGAVLSRLLAEPSPLLRSALIDFVMSRDIEGFRSLLERLERSDDDPAVRAKARTALATLT